MAFFPEKADADTKAQRDAEAALRSRRRDRESLAERLAVAEVAIVSYRAQARQLAADGADDKEITKVESRMRDSADRCVTLRGAIDDVDKIIAGLEAQIDKIVDKRCRAETSLAVDAMSTRLSKAASTFDEAAKELEAAAREILIIPEAQAVAEFTKSMHTQIPVAVEMILAAMKAHSHGVLSGHAPASLPRPAPPAPVLTVVPAAEPMQTIFIKRNLKYLDQAGRTVTIAGNRRHSLPQKLAELALSTNLALPLSDRQAIRDLEYNAPAFFVPDETSCIWLGPKGKEAPPKFMRPGGGPPIHSSLTTFETHPDYVNAKPFTVTVPRGPEAMPLAAARKADEE